MNILIIEDDKLTLHALEQILESLGHKTTLAGNAEEAIERIKNETFDLVFSDIMMPGISGLSLVSILRKINFFKMPIIAMSVLKDKPLLQAAFDAGATDFMLKPFTPEDLKTKLEIVKATVTVNVEKK